MTKTEDFFEAAGGPAFPYVAEGGNDSGLHPDLQPGMTLRDWFAGQAIVGSVARVNHDLPAEWVVAERAYKIADAMLAERGRG